MTVDRSSSVLPKSVSTAKIAPNTHELDNLNAGNWYSGPSRPPSPHGVQPSMNPNELEMSQPPHPANEEAADIIQTLSNPPMNKYRLLSACLMCFGNGINGRNLDFWHWLHSATKFSQTALPVRYSHTLEVTMRSAMRLRRRSS